LILANAFGSEMRQNLIDALKQIEEYKTRKEARPKEWEAKRKDREEFLTDRGWPITPGNLAWAEAWLKYYRGEIEEVPPLRPPDPPEPMSKKQYGKVIKERVERFKGVEKK
ncbi:MAG: hypothetical protein AB1478_11720, partial [Nitrospirota bacterium]